MEAPRAIEVLKAVGWLSCGSHEKTVLRCLVLADGMDWETWRGPVGAAVLVGSSGLSVATVKRARARLVNSHLLAKIETEQGEPDVWIINAAEIVATAQIIAAKAGARGSSAGGVVSEGYQYQAETSISAIPSSVLVSTDHRGLSKTEESIRQIPVSEGHRYQTDTTPLKSVALDTQGAKGWADPSRLAQVWQEEMMASPREIRGRPTGLMPNAHSDLLSLGEDAEPAVRAIATLCRGTETRAPRVLDWARLLGPRVTDAPWRDALAWVRGQAGEPALGRQWVGGTQQKAPRKAPDWPATDPHEGRGQISAPTPSDGSVGAMFRGRE